MAPGQTGGVSDNGEIIHIKGWVLLFSPELLHGTDLGRRIDNYHFFSYYESESLHPTPEEQRTIEVCFKMIRNELRSKADNEHLRRIIMAYLELILEYCAGFYERQLKTEITADNDLLKRFDDLLNHYYSEGRQRSWACRPSAIVLRSCFFRLTTSATLSVRLQARQRQPSSATS